MVDTAVFVILNKTDVISTKEGVELTIDCGSLIDGSGIPNPVVKWYRNDVAIRNGSTLNVVISQDRRFAIVTSTLMAVGGQLGTEGIYSCEVCNGTSCVFRSSITAEICGK